MTVEQVRAYLSIQVKAAAAEQAITDYISAMIDYTGPSYWKGFSMRDVLEDFLAFHEAPIPEYHQ